MENNVGENVKKLETYALLVYMENDTVIVKNCLVVFQKVKSRITI